MRRGSASYAVSIEARTGVSTGISAADRARTIQVAVGAHSSAADLVQPGLFPIMVGEDGVLRRAGFAEAGLDLARIAGRTPAAVVTGILDDAGDVARGEQLLRFAGAHGLPIGSIADLIAIWASANCA